MHFAVSAVFPLYPLIRKSCNSTLRLGLTTDPSKAPVETIGVSGDAATSILEGVNPSVRLTFAVFGSRSAAGTCVVLLVQQ